MRRCLGLLVVATNCLGVAAAAGPKPDELRWPQFRGPEGLAVASAGVTYPVRFGPDSHVLWKTPLPGGNSSPAVWGERIYLTAFDKPKQLLETICLERRTGQILWRRAAPKVA
ncbi:MAG TPA: PQQ-binding-like beta-propeller repeat protein, partial [Planctomycetaceae bacterium]|nr:PQQ-binding-like beta-propeller repeat protein [Planctomycetaceae bacterium]